MLVQVQGILLIASFLLLQPEGQHIIPYCALASFLCHPDSSQRAQTLAMAAEATSRAARRRGLSRAISDVRVKAQ